MLAIVVTKVLHFMNVTTTESVKWKECWMLLHVVLTVSNGSDGVIISGLTQSTERKVVLLAANRTRDLIPLPTPNQVR
jgi:hypothetical protein